MRRILVQTALVILAVVTGIASARSDTYTDDFSGGLNSTFWHVSTNQPLYSVVGANGEVEISKPSGGSYSFQAANVDFPYSFGGDFDVSIDFRNASITRINGTPGNQVQLNVIFGGQYFSLVRSDEIGSGNNVHVYLDPPRAWYGARSFSATSGSFRIIRHGAVVSGYVNGTLIYSGTFNTGNVTRLWFSLQNNGTTDATSVAFDNFRLQAGAITGLPPTADAGPDQTVDEGSSVLLDGSASSDPFARPLTYTWSQVAGPPVTLDLSDPVRPRFTAPSVPVGGVTLTFQLIVNNGELDSAPSAVNVTVKNVNHPPVAEAGEDLTVPEDSAVQLDGSASYDLDGESLSYAWAQTAGTLVTLADSDTPTPSFIAPSVGSAGETLTFQLVVSDGIDDSSPAIVNVNVTNLNQAPTANAGPDFSANENTQVTLAGSGTDPDLDPLTYSWAQTAGSPVILSDPTIPNPSFEAPFVDLGGETLTFSLVVNDGQLDSLPSVVSVHVLNSDDPPSCATASPSIETLWPPNHKLVDVGILGVVDPQGDPVTITVTGVTSDEPTSGLGDGDSSPDAVILGNRVLLRAERWDEGDGRVYTVNFTAADPYGESCTGSVQVDAPKNKKKGSNSIDNGQSYDATAP